VPLERENVFRPVKDPREGVVTGVRGNLIGISVGSSSGVKVGDGYTLMRGEAYVGEMVIKNVDKGLSVGEWVDTHGTGPVPQVGDKAAPGRVKRSVAAPVPHEGAPGVVHSVGPKGVRISVGWADKVKIGDVYSLSRGGQYVGRIVITSLDENESVGAFDMTFKGSGAPPQAGDKATPGGLE
jgi:hypothetical protein